MTVSSTRAPVHQFEHKKDGILWARPDHSIAYLTAWQRIKYVFGWRGL